MPILAGAAVLAALAWAYLLAAHGGFWRTGQRLPGDPDGPGHLDGPGHQGGPGRPGPGPRGWPRGGAGKPAPAQAPKQPAPHPRP
ncbi:MAG: hypothetical protein ACHP9Z_29840, partial [Streptosporangiales bacterium]